VWDIGTDHRRRSYKRCHVATRQLVQCSLRASVPVSRWPASVLRRDTGPHEGLSLWPLPELLSVRALSASIEHRRING